MKNKAILVISAISLLAFLAIMINLSSAGLIGIDFSVNRFMESIQTAFFIKIGEGIGWIFDTTSAIVIIAIVAGILWIKRLKKDAIFLALTGAVAGGFIWLFKEIIGRARPLNRVISETNFAYPSGHATISIVLFGFLIYLSLKYVKSQILRNLAVLGSGIMILVIGFSRLYLNVHWLSDVLGGFALGLFLLLLGFWIRNQYG